MFRKTCLLSFCILLFFPKSLKSQSTAVETLSEPEFENLTYDVFATQESNDSITILLTVKDNFGNFVMGMANPQKKHEYFNDLLDKTGKEISKDFTVSYSTIENSQIPIYISLVLDYSNSAIDDYQNMQNGVKDFIKSLPGVYFTRVNFGKIPFLIDSVPTRTPTPFPLKEDFSKYGRGTALLAAADLGIKSLEKAPGLRFIILVTDGQENSSGNVFGRACTPSELVENAYAARTSIFAVGFNLGTAPMVTNICTATKGSFFPIAKKQDLSNTFKKIRSAFFSQYYIIHAKRKGLPAAINIDKPDGAFKTTVLIPENLPWSDTTFYPIGFGTVQFELIRDTTIKVINGIDQKKYLDGLTGIIVSRLASDPKLKIRIEGHASPETGSDEINEKLANQRAYAVYKVIKENLKVHGNQILKRLEYRGFGASQPIYPRTSTLTSLNRRVEIRGVH